MQKVLSAFAGLLASTSFAMAIPPAMTPNIGEVGTNFVKTDLEGCKLLSQPGIEISTIKHMANGRVESTFTVPETQPSSEIRNKIFSDREQVEVTFEVKDSENFPGALPRSLYVMRLEYPGIRWSIQLLDEPSGPLTVP